MIEKKLRFFLGNKENYQSVMDSLVRLVNENYGDFTHNKRNFSILGFDEKITSSNRHIVFRVFECENDIHFLITCDLNKEVDAIYTCVLPATIETMLDHIDCVIKLNTENQHVQPHKNPSFMDMLNDILDKNPFPDFAACAKHKDEKVPEEGPVMAIRHIQINKAKRTTTVIFKDGDVQVIRCHKKDEFDANVGVALAIAQHLYHTKNQFHKFVNKTVKYVEEKKETKKPRNKK